MICNIKRESIKEKLFDKNSFARGNNEKNEIDKSQREKARNKTIS